MANTTRRAPRTGRARTGITLAAAGLLSTMVAPAAFAAPSGDQGVTVQPGNVAVGVQDATAGAGTSETQGASDGSGDLETEGSLEVADHLETIDVVVDLDGTGCEDHLVTLTPAGATGPAPEAVAITAQAHEWGQPGWDMASWAASGGITISAVTAQAADGATSTLSATLTGTAHDVAALTFCGTATATEPSPADRAEEAEEAPGSVTDADKDSADEAAGASAEAPVMTTAADDPAATADAGDEPFGVVTVDTTNPAPMADGDPNAAHDPSAAHEPAPGGDVLTAVPAAHTAPTTTGANSTTVLGSTAIGLLTTGLLGAALLALAAFRRTARTHRADLGGQP